MSMSFEDQLAHPDVEPDLLADEIEIYRKAKAMTDDEIDALAADFGVPRAEVVAGNQRIIDRMRRRVSAGQISEDVL